VAEITAGITVEQIVSADGYAMDRRGGIDFFDEVDFGDQSRTDTEQMRWLAGMDAILFGRRTYELFADYWPFVAPAEDAAAEPINRLPKYVLSSTLGTAPWGDGEITVLRGDPAEAVPPVLTQHRSVAVWGSLRLTDALFDAGMVSRLRLRATPVLLGEGRAVAPATLAQTALRLEHVDHDPSGVVTTQYRLLGGDGAR